MNPAARRVYASADLPPYAAAADLPAVAVGVLSFNRAADVLATLNALVRSDYPPDKLHLVVVDNASTDGTCGLVRQAFGHRVQILALPENIGAVARNRVILGRTEPYVFMFDEDCHPQDATTIRRAVQFMQAHPQLGALCMRSINMFTGASEWGNFHSISRRRHPDGWSEGVCVVGNGMCFKTSVLRHTEGYDERLFWGTEELALGMELLSHNVRIAYNHGIALIHRHAPRAMGGALVAQAEVRNIIWIALRYLPLPMAVAVAALHLTRRVLMPLLKGRAGLAAGALRGFRASLRGMRPFLATRKPIPLSRIAAHNRWFVNMFIPQRGMRR